MSKAFTREDDLPVPSPPPPRRAPLPSGVANYVTARGLAALRAELAEMDAVRTLPSALPASSWSQAERQVREVSDARRRALESRIASAVVVTNTGESPGTVRFGAEVEVQAADGPVRTYRLVGVDEANAARGLLAFVSPLARALLGRRVGDAVLVSTPRGEEELQVLAVRYPDD